MNNRYSQRNPTYKNINTIPSFSPDSYKQVFSSSSFNLSEKQTSKFSKQSRNNVESPAFQSLKSSRKNLQKPINHSVPELASILYYDMNSELRKTNFNIGCLKRTIALEKDRQNRLENENTYLKENIDSLRDRKEKIEVTRENFGNKTNNLNSQFEKTQENLNKKILKLQNKHKSLLNNKRELETKNINYCKTKKDYEEIIEELRKAIKSLRQRESNISPSKFGELNQKKIMQSKEIENLMTIHNEEMQINQRLQKEINNIIKLLEKVSNYEFFSKEFQNRKKNYEKLIKKLEKLISQNQNNLKTINNKKGYPNNQIELLSLSYKDRFQNELIRKEGLQNELREKVGEVEKMLQKNIKLKNKFEEQLEQCKKKPNIIKHKLNDFKEENNWKSIYEFKMKYPKEKRINGGESLQKERKIKGTNLFDKDIQLNSNKFSVCIYTSGELSLGGKVKDNTPVENYNIKQIIDHEKPLVKQHGSNGIDNEKGRNDFSNENSKEVRTNINLVINATQKPKLINQRYSQDNEIITNPNLSKKDLALSHKQKNCIPNDSLNNNELITRNQIRENKIEKNNATENTDNNSEFLIEQFENKVMKNKKDEFSNEMSEKDQESNTDLISSKDIKINNNNEKLITMENEQQKKALCFSDNNLSVQPIIKNDFIDTHKLIENEMKTQVISPLQNKEDIPQNYLKENQGLTKKNQLNIEMREPESNNSNSMNTQKSLHKTQFSKETTLNDQSDILTKKQLQFSKANENIVPIIKNYLNESKTRNKDISDLLSPKNFPTKEDKFRENNLDLNSENSNRDNNKYVEQKLNKQNDKTPSKHLIEELNKKDSINEIKGLLQKGEINPGIFETQTNKNKIYVDENKQKKETAKQLQKHDGHKNLAEDTKNQQIFGHVNFEEPKQKDNKTDSNFQNKKFKIPLSPNSYKVIGNEPKQEKENIVSKFPTKTELIQQQYDIPPLLVNEMEIIVLNQLKNEEKKSLKSIETKGKMSDIKNNTKKKENKNIKENQHEEITQIKNIKDCFENQNSIEDKTNNNKGKFSIVPNITTENDNENNHNSISLEKRRNELFDKEQNIINAINNKKENILIEPNTMKKKLTKTKGNDIKANFGKQSPQSLLTHSNKKQLSKSTPKNKINKDSSREKTNEVTEKSCIIKDKEMIIFNKPTEDNPLPQNEKQQFSLIGNNPNQTLKTLKDEQKIVNEKEIINHLNEKQNKDNIISQYEEPTTKKKPETTSKIMPKNKQGLSTLNDRNNTNSVIQKLSSLKRIDSLSQENKKIHKNNEVFLPTKEDCSSYRKEEKECLLENFSSSGLNDNSKSKTIPLENKNNQHYGNNDTINNNKIETKKYKEIDENYTLQKNHNAIKISNNDEFINFNKDKFETLIFNIQKSILFEIGKHLVRKVTLKETSIVDKTHKATLKEICTDKKLEGLFLQKTENLKVQIEDISKQQKTQNQMYHTIIKSTKPTKNKTQNLSILTKEINQVNSKIDNTQNQRNTPIFNRTNEFPASNKPNKATKVILYNQEKEQSENNCSNLKNDFSNLIFDKDNLPETQEITENILLHEKRKEVENLPQSESKEEKVRASPRTQEINKYDNQNKNIEKVVSKEKILLDSNRKKNITKKSKSKSQSKNKKEDTIITNLSLKKRELNKYESKSFSEIEKKEKENILEGETDLEQINQNIKGIKENKDPLLNNKLNINKKHDIKETIADGKINGIYLPLNNDVQNLKNEKQVIKDVKIKEGKLPEILKIDKENNEKEQIHDNKQRKVKDVSFQNTKTNIKDPITLKYPFNESLINSTPSKELQEKALNISQNENNSRHQNFLQETVQNKNICLSGRNKKVIIPQKIIDEDLKTNNKNALFVRKNKEDYKKENGFQIDLQTNNKKLIEENIKENENNLNSLTQSEINKKNEKLGNKGPPELEEKINQIKTTPKSKDKRKTMEKESGNQLSLSKSREKQNFSKEQFIRKEKDKEIIAKQKPQFTDDEKKNSHKSLVSSEKKEGIQEHISKENNLQRDDDITTECLISEKNQEDTIINEFQSKEKMKVKNDDVINSEIRNEIKGLMKENKIGKSEINKSINKDEKEQKNEIRMVKIKSNEKIQKSNTKDSTKEREQKIEKFLYLKDNNQNEENSNQVLKKRKSNEKSKTFNGKEIEKSRTISNDSRAIITKSNNSEKKEKHKQKKNTEIKDKFSEKDGKQKDIISNKNEKNQTANIILVENLNNVRKKENIKETQFDKIKDEDDSVSKKENQPIQSKQLKNKTNEMSHFSTTPANNNDNFNSLSHKKDEKQTIPKEQIISIDNENLNYVNTQGKLNSITTDLEKTSNNTLININKELFTKNDQKVMSQKEKLNSQNDILINNFNNDENQIEKLNEKTNENKHLIPIQEDINKRINILNNERLPLLEGDNTRFTSGNLSDVDKINNTENKIDLNIKEQQNTSKSNDKNKDDKFTNVDKERESSNKNIPFPNTDKVKESKKNDNKVKESSSIKEIKALIPKQMQTLSKKEIKEFQTETKEKIILKSDQPSKFEDINSKSQEIHVTSNNDKTQNIQTYPTQQKDTNQKMDKIEEHLRDEDTTKDENKKETKQKDTPKLNTFGIKSPQFQENKIVISTKSSKNDISCSKKIDNSESTEPPKKLNFISYKKESTSDLSSNKNNNELKTKETQTSKDENTIFPENKKVSLLMNITELTTPLNSANLKNKIKQIVKDEKSEINRQMTTKYIEGKDEELIEPLSEEQIKIGMEPNFTDSQPLKDNKGKKKGTNTVRQENLHPKPREKVNQTDLEKDILSSELQEFTPEKLVSKIHSIDNRENEKSLKTIEGINKQSQISSKEEDMEGTNEPKYICRDSSSISNNEMATIKKEPIKIKEKESANSPVNIENKIKEKQVLNTDIPIKKETEHEEKENNKVKSNEIQEIKNISHKPNQDKLVDNLTNLPKSVQDKSNQSLLPKKTDINNFISSDISVLKDKRCTLSSNIEIKKISNDEKNVQIENKSHNQDEVKDNEKNKKQLTVGDFSEKDKKFLFPKEGTETNGQTPNVSTNINNENIVKKLSNQIDNLPKEKDILFYHVIQKEELSKTRDIDNNLFPSNPKQKEGKKDDQNKSPLDETPKVMNELFNKDEKKGDYFCEQNTENTDTNEQISINKTISQTLKNNIEQTTTKEEEKQNEQIKSKTKDLINNKDIKANKKVTEINQESSDNSIETEQYITLSIQNIAKNKENLKLTENENTVGVTQKPNLPTEQKTEEKIIKNNKNVENLSFKAIQKDMNPKKDKIKKKGFNPNDTFSPISINKEENRLKEDIPSCEETQCENKKGSILQNALKSNKEQIKDTLIIENCKKTEIPIFSKEEMENLQNKEAMQQNIRISDVKSQTVNLEKPYQSIQKDDINQIKHSEFIQKEDTNLLQPNELINRDNNEKEKFNKQDIQTGDTNINCPFSNSPNKEIVLVIEEEKKDKASKSLEQIDKLIESLPRNENNHLEENNVISNEKYNKSENNCGQGEKAIMKDTELQIYESQKPQQVNNFITEKSEKQLQENLLPKNHNISTNIDNKKQKNEEQTFRNETILSKCDSLEKTHQTLNFSPENKKPFDENKITKIINPKRSDEEFTVFPRELAKQKESNTFVEKVDTLIPNNTSGSLDVNSQNNENLEQKEVNLFTIKEKDTIFNPKEIQINDSKNMSLGEKKSLNPLTSEEKTNIIKSFSNNTDQIDNSKINEINKEKDLTIDENKSKEAASPKNKTFARLIEKDKPLISDECTDKHKSRVKEDTIDSISNGLLKDTVPKNKDRESKLNENKVKRFIYENIDTKDNKHIEDNLNVVTKKINDKSNVIQNSPLNEEQDTISIDKRKKEISECGKQYGEVLLKEDKEESKLKEIPMFKEEKIGNASFDKTIQQLINKITPTQNKGRTKEPEQETKIFDNNEITNFQSNKDKNEFIQNEISENNKFEVISEQLTRSDSPLINRKNSTKLNEQKEEGASQQYGQKSQDLIKQDSQQNCENTTKNILKETTPLNKDKFKSAKELSIDEQNKKSDEKLSLEKEIITKPIFNENKKEQIEQNISLSEKEKNISVVEKRNEKDYEKSQQSAQEQFDDILNISDNIIILDKDENKELMVKENIPIKTLISTTEEVINHPLNENQKGFTQINIRAPDKDKCKDIQIIDYNKKDNKDPLGHINVKINGEMIINDVNRDAHKQPVNQKENEEHIKIFESNHINLLDSTKNADKILNPKIIPNIIDSLNYQDTPLNPVLMENNSFFREEPKFDINLNKYIIDSIHKENKIINKNKLSNTNFDNGKPSQQLLSEISGIDLNLSNKTKNVISEKEKLPGKVIQLIKKDEKAKDENLNTQQKIIQSKEITPCLNKNVNDLVQNEENKYFKEEVCNLKKSPKVDIVKENVENNNCLFLPLHVLSEISNDNRINNKENDMELIKEPVLIKHDDLQLKKKEFGNYKTVSILEEENKKTKIIEKESERKKKENNSEVKQDNYLINIDFDEQGKIKEQKIKSNKNKENKEENEGKIKDKENNIKRTKLITSESKNKMIEEKYSKYIEKQTEIESEEKKEKIKELKETGKTKNKNLESKIKTREKKLEEMKKEKKKQKAENIILVENLNNVRKKENIKETQFDKIKDEDDSVSKKENQPIQSKQLKNKTNEMSHFSTTPANNNDNFNSLSHKKDEKQTIPKEQIISIDNENLNYVNTQGKLNSITTDLEKTSNNTLININKELFTKNDQKVMSQKEKLNSQNDILINNFNNDENQIEKLNEKTNENKHLIPIQEDINKRINILNNERLPLLEGDNTRFTSGNLSDVDKINNTENKIDLNIKEQQNTSKSNDKNKDDKFTNVDKERESSNKNIPFPNTDKVKESKKNDNKVKESSSIKEIKALIPKQMQTLSKKEIKEFQTETKEKIILKSDQPSKFEDINSKSQEIHVTSNNDKTQNIQTYPTQQKDTNQKMDKIEEHLRDEDTTKDENKKETKQKDTPKLNTFGIKSPQFQENKIVISTKSSKNDISCSKKIDNSESTEPPKKLNFISYKKESTSDLSSNKNNNELKTKETQTSKDENTIFPENKKVSLLMNITELTTPLNSANLKNKIKQIVKDEKSEINRQMTTKYIEGKDEELIEPLSEEQIKIGMEPNFTDSQPLKDNKGKKKGTNTVRQENLHPKPREKVNQTDLEKDILSSELQEFTPEKLVSKIHSIDNRENEKSLKTIEGINKQSQISSKEEDMEGTNEPKYICRDSSSISNNEMATIKKEPIKIKEKESANSPVNIENKIKEKQVLNTDIPIKKETEHEEKENNKVKSNEIQEIKNISHKPNQDKLVDNLTNLPKSVQDKSNQSLLPKKTDINNFISSDISVLKDKRCTLSSNIEIKKISNDEKNVQIENKSHNQDEVKDNEKNKKQLTVGDFSEKDKKFLFPKEGTETNGQTPNVSTNINNENIVKKLSNQIDNLPKEKDILFYHVIQKEELSKTRDIDNNLFPSNPKQKEGKKDDQNKSPLDETPKVMNELFNKDEKKGDYFCEQNTENTDTNEQISINKTISQTLKNNIEQTTTKEEEKQNEQIKSKTKDLINNKDIKANKKVTEINQESSDNSIETEQYITLSIQNIAKNKENLKLTENENTVGVTQKPNLPTEQKTEEKIIKNNKNVENLSFKAIQKDMNPKKDKIKKKGFNPNDTFSPISINKEENRLKEDIPSCEETQCENKKGSILQNALKSNKEQIKDTLIIENCKKTEIPIFSKEEMENLQNKEAMQQNIRISDVKSQTVNLEKPYQSIQKDDINQIKHSEFIQKEDTNLLQPNELINRDNNEKEKFNKQDIQTGDTNINCPFSNSPNKEIVLVIEEEKKDKASKSLEQIDKLIESLPRNENNHLEENNVISNEKYNKSENNCGQGEKAIMKDTELQIYESQKPQQVNNFITEKSEKQLQENLLPKNHNISTNIDNKKQKNEEQTFRNETILSKCDSLEKTHQTLNFSPENKKPFDENKITKIINPKRSDEEFTVFPRELAKQKESNTFVEKVDTLIPNNTSGSLDVNSQNNENLEQKEVNLFTIKEKDTIFNPKEIQINDSKNMSLGEKKSLNPLTSEEKTNIIKSFSNNTDQIDNSKINEINKEKDLTIDENKSKEAASPKNKTFARLIEKDKPLISDECTDKHKSRVKEDTIDSISNGLLKDTVPKNKDRESKLNENKVKRFIYENIDTKDNKHIEDNLNVVTKKINDKSNVIQNSPLNEEQDTISIDKRKKEISECGKQYGEVLLKEDKEESKLKEIPMFKEEKIGNASFDKTIQQLINKITPTQNKGRTKEPEQETKIFDNNEITNFQSNKDKNEFIQNEISENNKFEVISEQLTRSDSPLINRKNSTKLNEQKEEGASQQYGQKSQDLIKQDSQQNCENTTKNILKETTPLNKDKFKSAKELSIDEQNKKSDEKLSLEKEIITKPIFNENKKEQIEQNISLSEKEKNISVVEKRNEKDYEKSQQSAQEQFDDILNISDNIIILDKDENKELMVKENIPIKTLISTTEEVINHPLNENQKGFTQINIRAPDKDKCKDIQIIDYNKKDNKDPLGHINVKINGEMIINDVNRDAHKQPVNQKENEEHIKIFDKYEKLITKDYLLSELRNTDSNSDDTQTSGHKNQTHLSNPPCHNTLAKISTYNSVYYHKFQENQNQDTDLFSKPKEIQVQIKRDTMLFNNDFTEISGLQNNEKQEKLSILNEEIINDKRQTTAKNKINVLNSSNKIEINKENQEIVNEMKMQLNNNEEKEMEENYKQSPDNFKLISQYKDKNELNTEENNINLNNKGLIESLNETKDKFIVPETKPLPITKDIKIDLSAKEKINNISPPQKKIMSNSIVNENLLLKENSIINTEKALHKSDLIAKPFKLNNQVNLTNLEGKQLFTNEVIPLTSRELIKAEQPRNDTHLTRNKDENISKISDQELNNKKNYSQNIPHFISRDNFNQVINPQQNCSEQSLIKMNETNSKFLIIDSNSQETNILNQYEPSEFSQNTEDRQSVVSLLLKEDIIESLNEENEIVPTFLYNIQGNSLYKINLLSKQKMKIENTKNFQNIIKKINNKSPYILLNTLKGTFLIIEKKLYYYSPRKNKFSFITHLLYGHYFGTAVIALSKVEIILISGRDTSNVEIVNIKENKISLFPSLNQAREKACSCIINDKLFVFMGSCPHSFKPLETIEFFNLKNPDKWEVLEHTLPFNFFGTNCFPLDKDKIIFIGGKDQADESLDLLLLFDLSNGYGNALKHFDNLEEGLTFINQKSFCIYKNNADNLGVIMVDDKSNIFSFNSIDDCSIYNTFKSSIK